METIENPIEHSLCFGVFDAYQNQAGFASVANDFRCLWLDHGCFYFTVLPWRSLGKLLIAVKINHQTLQEVKRMGLTTKDAHGLFE